MAVSGRKVNESNMIVSAAPLPFDDPALLLWVVAISLIVTWTLGLTPLLLIRYVFLRRALNKKTATWIAAGISIFLWMAFTVMHIALDEKPGTGAAWAIVFLVSRWIMFRGYPQTKKD